MKNLTKQKKMEIIREIVDNQKITAYAISKGTNITESGIQRVLNGDTKNPHINTVNSIYNYLNDNYLGDAENEVNDSLAAHSEEIKQNMGNIMETLIKKIVEEQTAGKFDAINQNILTLFKNQMDLNNADLKNEVKPLLKGNAPE